MCSFVVTIICVLKLRKSGYNPPKRSYHSEKLSKLCGLSKKIPSQWKALRMRCCLNQTSEVPKTSEVFLPGFVYTNPGSSNNIFMKSIQYCKVSQKNLISGKGLSIFILEIKILPRPSSPSRPYCHWVQPD